MWFLVISFALTVLASAGAGCKGNCRTLAEKLCECSNGSLEKESCLKRVATEEERATVTVEDEEACGGLLAGGDCHALDTAEGKRACGLAR